jgi:hypothetical protein
VSASYIGMGTTSIAIRTAGHTVTWYCRNGRNHSQHHTHTTKSTVMVTATSTGSLIAR